MPSAQGPTTGLRAGATLWAEDTHPLILVGAEEPRVVPLLNHYEGDPWLVVFF